MFRSAFLQDLLRYPSLVGAILVNILPLLALVVWRWDLGALVLLYWLENLVVGGVTLLRMSTCGLAGQNADCRRQFILAPFFMLHYGLFCFVHGAFLFTFLTNGAQIDTSSGSPIALVNRALQAAPGVPAVLGIIACWRLTLFVTQFLMRGEYLQSNAMKEMSRPYARIVTMHVAIIVGALALSALGQPLWGVVGLIAMKAVFDFIGVRKDARGMGASELSPDPVARVDPRAAGRLMRAQQRRGPKRRE